MASITITIGPVTATREIGNARAQQYALLYAQARAVPDTATDQEKLDAVVDGMVAHVRAVARRQHVDNAGRDAGGEFDVG